MPEVKVTSEEFEYWKRAKTDPTWFAETHFSIEGLPYNLNKFPYVREVLNDKSEFIVLLWGRSLTKSTVVCMKAAHGLITHPYSQCLASAPTDPQAWRLTTDYFRPSIYDSQEDGFLRPLIDESEGPDQIGQIKLSNNSKWIAKGAFLTGKSLRGPHTKYGIADEFQDWTRTAWTVFLEVVNKPGRQILISGTGGPEGTIFYEIWEKTDKKEWDPATNSWIKTNPNADSRYSGYHLSQAHSPFESPESIKDKKRSYPTSLYASEVEAVFFSSMGLKPAPYTLVDKLRVTDPEKEKVIMQRIVKTSLGVDWGHESSWVLGGLTDTGALIIISSGNWGDTSTDPAKEYMSPLEVHSADAARRAKKHVIMASKLIEEKNPDYVLLDSGWSQNKNQELMRMYPGKCWAVTTGDRPTRFPSWNIRKENKHKGALPKKDWEYSVDIDHTRMCEELETRIENKTVWLLDTKENDNSVESLMTEWNLADAVEVETKETVKRRFVITRAHKFAATCYLNIPFLKSMTKGRTPGAY